MLVLFPSAGEFVGEKQKMMPTQVSWVATPWTALGEPRVRRPVLGQCGPPGGSRDQGTALPFVFPP